MTTKTKPMSAENLVLCLAGEIGTFPGLIVETIKADRETLALVRRYGKGEVTYQEVLEAVNSIC